MEKDLSKLAAEGSSEQDSGAAFAARVRAATELLREIRDNRRLIATLDEEQYRELLILAGQVARPGPYAKRELAREAVEHDAIVALDDETSRQRKGTSQYQSHQGRTVHNVGL